MTASALFILIAASGERTLSEMPVSKANARTWFKAGLRDVAQGLDAGSTPTNLRINGSKVQGLVVITELGEVVNYGSSECEELIGEAL